MATNRKAIPRKRWADSCSEKTQLEIMRGLKITPYCFKPDPKSYGTCCHMKIEKGNKCDFCRQFFRFDELQKPEIYNDVNIDRGDW